MKKDLLTIPLPDHKIYGSVSLEEAMYYRKSTRTFSSEALTKIQLAQILWSCYGFTNGASGRRVVPSAGAFYPFTTYVCIGKQGVLGLEEGLYLYHPELNNLTLRTKGDVRLMLFTGCLSQNCIRQAPISIVFCADYTKMRERYGKRGKRYIDMEAGHIGQNIYLQTSAMGLGTVAVGAFDDDCVFKILKLKQTLVPLYIFPVGKPA